MSKIKSLADLRKMKQQFENEINIREKSENSENLIKVRVAMATCGIAAGARAVMNTVIDRIDKDGIPAIVTQSGCMGYCFAEPTIEITKPGEEPIVFGNVSTEKANEIVDKYILKGELVDGIIPVNYQTINDKN